MYTLEDYLKATHLESQDFISCNKDNTLVFEIVKVFSYENCIRFEIIDHSGRNVKLPPFTMEECNTFLVPVRK